MDDKTVMENLLLTTKGVCDLYLHGTVESAGTTDVHAAFKTALDSALTMQNDIYKTMTDKGWYPTTNAQPGEIRQVKNKFTCPPPTC
ncbi:MAG: spore coat protein [Clostridia bacterium]|nr:spore coat protein [Clostridia bacterium]